METPNRKSAEAPINQSSDTMNCLKQTIIMQSSSILFIVLLCYLQVTTLTVAIKDNDNNNNIINQISSINRDSLEQEQYHVHLKAQVVSKGEADNNEKLLIRDRIIREINNIKYLNNDNNLAADSTLETTTFSSLEKQSSEQNSHNKSFNKSNETERNNNNYHNNHSNLFKNRNIIYKITMYTLNPIIFYIDYIYGTVFIIGVVGNVAVIYFIAVRSNSSKSEFERVTDFYICNLAGADLMFIHGLPFIIVQHISGKWVLGDLACKVSVVCFDFDFNL